MEGHAAALLWLLALGVLRFEETSKVRPKLYVTESPVPPLPPHIAPIVETVRAAEAKGGFAHDAFKALGNAYGPPLNRLPWKTSSGSMSGRPWLQAISFARGLGKCWDCSRARTIRPRPAKRPCATAFAAGSTARRLPELLASDPAESRAIVAALGSAILLVPELEPHHTRVAELLRGRDAQSSRGPDGDHADGIGPGPLDAGAFGRLADCREAFEGVPGPLQLCGRLRVIRLRCAGLNRPAPRTPASPHPAPRPSRSAAGRHRSRRCCW